MKKSKYSDEQMVQILREADRTDDVAATAKKHAGRSEESRTLTYSQLGDPDGGCWPNAPHVCGSKLPVM
jgi:hypothetical protein